MKERDVCAILKVSDESRHKKSHIWNVEEKNELKERANDKHFKKDASRTWIIDQIDLVH